MISSLQDQDLTWKVLGPLLDPLEDGRILWLETSKSDLWDDLVNTTYSRVWNANYD